MKKFLFGIFTFSLGLVLGLFFNKMIFGLFPEMDDVLKGGILVITVVVFFFVWRFAEWTTSKKDTKTNLP